ncbi:MAG: cob(I)yrinic acid a,c-diamide adenosyltransferase [Candidatus Levybacteria bacterium]|nr:cob(I)yrinic acid a,c-diamide adenosyltransferase [Candidatus Levybacteria bacterium]
MAIYTKKGDKGKTSLFDGTKVSKFNRRIEALGTVDELNSVLGICAAFVKNRKIKKELEIIQNDLFEIGGSLAFPHPMPLDFLPERILEFERLIDKLTKKLPQLSNFILPGGGKGGAYLHLARTVTRRAERRIVEVSEKGPTPSSGQGKIDPNILIYLNRLSDLMFTFARYVNHKEKPFGKLRPGEKIWKKR